MPGRLQEQVLAHLDELIRDGERVVGSYRDGGIGGLWSEFPEQQLWAFVTAGAAEVERVGGAHSQFFKQLPPPLKSSEHLAGTRRIPAATLGALLALRSAVAGGRLQQLEARMRAAVHDDFLQQAVDLLAANYHVAAMVLVGGVLEHRLRHLCLAGNLAPAGQNLNGFNQALRNADVYGQATWRQIQVVGDVRNNAAHGHHELVHRAQVDEQLAFVQRFLAEHEA